MKAEIEAFFDPNTRTISYVVYDHPQGHAAIIDPVLDYDPKSGQIQTVFADRLINFVQNKGLSVDWILETHAHADHLSAAHYLKQKLGSKLGIGEHVGEVQTHFKQLLNLGGDVATDGSQFDGLFADGEVFTIGQLQARVLFLPGHTPADIAYQVEDAVFVGDTLFMPDVGTARCDFPGGNAHTLYHSIQKLFALPEATRLFMCHDYPPTNRPTAWETTVKVQRQHNIHIRDGVSESEFVSLRQTKDAAMEMPVLIWPALQVNIRAGELPPAEHNGMRYLKTPLQLNQP